MPQKVVKEKGILHLNGIDSAQIKNLLAEWHARDVFIPECKNGETWGARDLLKLDAWVLRRTYSPLTTIGYEIKCSRADFEQDQKWTGYLGLCHLFYFVCPAGLIRGVDLPQQIGLIWVSKDKLHAKRKAERLTPDINKLNGLLIYALMSRSKIVANMNEIHTTEPKDRLQEMREETEKAREKGELGHFIRGHVRQVYEACRAKENQYANREYQLKKFEERLAKLGIKWDSNSDGWLDTGRVSSEIDALKEIIDYKTLDGMRSVSERLTRLVETIDKYRGDHA